MSLDAWGTENLLSWGEIKDYRDVGKIGGRQYKIFHSSSRRLSKGEENAVALIGLRMVSENRRWIPGETHEVSVGSVMTRVFDNPKLMTRTVFETWFKRVGIKRVRHTTSTRGSWLLVPNDLDGRTMAFGDPGPGTCWEILVKPDVLYEAMSLHAKNKWQRNSVNGNVQKSDPPEGDAVTGRHSILGSPEGNQDLETGEGSVDPSGCLQAATPAQSPHNAQDEEVTMGPPLIFRTDEWQAEVNRVYNEHCDNAQMAIEPPWLKPSDPRNIVESLNNIDKLLDEAEQMSQVGYGEHDEESELEDVAIMPAPERPSGTINVNLVHEQRRIVLPPEARGLDEDDD